MEDERRIRRLTIRNWAFIIASAVLSVWLGSKYGTTLRGSEAALSGIVSVFSILAGVLVAVISIVGDPSMLLSGNWRLGFTHAEATQIRLARYAHLIFIYIMILILVLAATLLKDSGVKGYDLVYQVLFALTSFALLMSLPLPYGLMSIQRERMTEEVKRRKGSAAA